MADVARATRDLGAPRGGEVTGDFVFLGGRNNKLWEWPLLLPLITASTRAATVGSTVVQTVVVPGFEAMSEDSDVGGCWVVATRLVRAARVSERPGQHRGSCGAPCPSRKWLKCRKCTT